MNINKIHSINFFCNIYILKVDVTKFLWHFIMLFIFKGPHPHPRPFWNWVVLAACPFRGPLPSPGDLCSFSVDMESRATHLLCAA